MSSSRLADLSEAYERAEAAFLAAVREAAVREAAVREAAVREAAVREAAVREAAVRTTLAARAQATATAAAAWNAEAYRKFHEAEDDAWMPLDHLTERTEVLEELWNDLAAAYAA